MQRRFPKLVVGENGGENMSGVDLELDEPEKTPLYVCPECGQECETSVGLGLHKRRAHV